MNIETRQAPSKVSSVDMEARTFEVVASTEAIDGHGCIVRQDWNLERFNLNPVIFFNHERRKPIGKCSVRVEDAQLIASVTLASKAANPESEELLHLVAEDILRGVSVGFRIGKRSTEKIDGRNVDVLSECELHEISLVGVPSNQNTLVRAEGAEDPIDDVVTKSAEQATADRVALVRTVANLFAVSGASTLQDADAWLATAKEVIDATKSNAVNVAVERAIAERRIKKGARDTYVALGASVGVASLETVLATIEPHDSSRDVQRILDDASIAGKIPPGMKSQWAEAGRALGDEWLSSVVGSLGVVGGTMEDALALASKPGDPGATPMDPELRRMLRAQGLTERDHREAMAYERAQREEGAL